VLQTFIAHFQMYIPEKGLPKFYTHFRFQLSTSYFPIPSSVIGLPTFFPTKM